MKKYCLPLVLTLTLALGFPASLTEAAQLKDTIVDDTLMILAELDVDGSSNFATPIAVGGAAHEAYSIFGDGDKIADEAVVSGKQDVFIQGNLELDGTIFAETFDGISKPNYAPYFSAAGMYDVGGTLPPLTQVAGTNITKLVRSWDETITENAGGTIPMPSDLDTGGTATFRAWLVPGVVDATNRNVEFDFGHTDVGNNATFDTAYTEENSGDLDVGATANFVTIHTWTESISTMGWDPNELIYWRVKRTDPSGNELPQKVHMEGIQIEVPRA